MLNYLNYYINPLLPGTNKQTKKTMLGKLCVLTVTGKHSFFRNALAWYSPLKGFPSLSSRLSAGSSSSAMLSPACPSGTLRSLVLSNVTGGSSFCSTILWTTVLPLWNGKVWVVSKNWSAGSWNVTVKRSTSSVTTIENLPSSSVISITFFLKMTLKFLTGSWLGPPTTFPVRQCQRLMLFENRRKSTVNLVKSVRFWKFPSPSAAFLPPSLWKRKKFKTTMN